MKKPVLILAVIGLLCVWASAPAQASDKTGPRLAISSFYSHTTTDDPMFHHGEPGVGHDHDFFCNTSTDAFSTYDSLTAAPELCKQNGDSSAYWAPVHADLEAGVYRALAPVDKMVGYYEVTPWLPQRQIKPFPRGFALVSRAAQGPGSVQYRCAGGTYKSAPPDRCGNQRLQVKYLAPSCWNGKVTDTAYSVVKAGSTACPSTHPTNVPLVLATILYKMPDPSLNLRISAGEDAWEGPGFDHMNMLNAWDQPKQVYKTDDCLRETSMSEPRPHHCQTAG